MKSRRHRQLMALRSVPQLTAAAGRPSGIIVPVAVPASAKILPVGLAPGLSAMSTPGISMRDSLTVLFRHKIKSIVFLVGTVTAAWLFTAHEMATYTSEALLLLRQGRENVSLDPTMTTGEISPVRQEWDQTINSEVSILRSRGLTEELVDKLGAELVVGALPSQHQVGGLGRLRAKLRELMHDRTVLHEPSRPVSPRSAAIKLLSEAVKVEAVERSDVIRIACTLGNADLAQRVVFEMIGICGARHTAAYSRPGSLEFFQAQTADCRNRLQQADDALRRAKNDLSIASLQTEREALAKRIAELRTQKETLDDRLVAALVQCTELSKKLDPEPGAGPAPSPEAYKVRRQALQAAELACHALQQEVVSTQVHLASALGTLKMLNDNESSVHGLQRERDLLEADYVKYVARLEEARISVALEKEKISNVNVIQSPTHPLEANQTRKSMLRIISLLLGLGGCLGIAFVSESLDDTIRQPQELERSKIRPLASLPRLNRRQIGLRVRRPRGAPGGEGQVCRQPPEAACHFETLVYHAVLAMEDRMPHPTLIGITSCYAGEGVSTIARNLAVALAGMNQEAQRSLLVEPNAQHVSWLPFMDRNLGPRATEFTRATNGDIAVIEHSIYRKVDEVVPAEQGGRDQELVRHARASNARFVLFDLPPLSEGVAAERMAAWMDHVVLVVESERVRWQIVANAQSRLAEARAFLLGAVLNKRRYHIPAWLYRRL